MWIHPGPHTLPSFLLRDQGVYKSTRKSNTGISDVTLLAWYEVERKKDLHFVCVCVCLFSVGLLLGPSSVPAP